MKPAKAHDGDAAIVVPLLAGNGDNNTAESANYQHCVSGSTSFFKTCFNGLNALSGVGILSIPYALSSGGWMSLILFFLIAGCTFYTGLLIQRCMDMDPNIRSYPDIGEQAFGAKGRAFVSLAMNVELYLVATDNMSILSYISASGVIASFVLIGSILWASTLDGIGFHEKGTLLNWKGMPTAVSLYAFCYCAHPVFPTLYTSMRNQKKFSKVLLVCFLVCTTSYASMAILGYMMFGSKLQSQITLNLPTDKTSSKVAIYTTLVNPLAKYALMVTPIITSLETLFQSHRNKGISTLIRTCLVLSTIIVALAIPFFGYLMSLVGAFLSVTASIILPCLCFLKISGIYGRFRLESISIWGIVLIGILVLVIEFLDHLDHVTVGDGERSTSHAVTRNG
ncbi:UNVERIFIED_CONTAM: Amino acid transporter AVT1I [Sesamum latifolium]|uniref:Amino acid transporter AVT1I n=1 Tax=Sesamum latifolium TaxID=2727402 RepID=A0AAW2XA60_9LAMI